ncbi:MAG: hypothetical protein IMX02_06260 [Limnochordaceae bacterium]|nr:hypothetical protein [Limnochordaceae bacterium]
MTVGELLAHANAARVRVYLDPEGQLRADVPDDAPPDVDALLDELKARAREVKAHLLAQADAKPSEPSAPRRPVPESLVRQVAKRLRSGRPVLLETAFGPVVLAPSLDAARWAEEKRPGVPVFLPYEARALLDCESPEEVELLVSVKRYLGARLLPDAPKGEGGDAPCPAC